MPPYLLVVESDPELQRRIGDTLREASYELSTETDGAWAKRSLLIRPPDGVVLDTNLTDGSGFAVADAIRKDPDTEAIPIFFVASRQRGAMHRTEARRRYAPAEYLITPLDLDTLLARVLETLPPRDPVAPSSIPFYPAGRLADRAQRRERREVEATARQLAGRGAAGARGTLAREPFARILQRLYTEKRTGALLLVRDDVKKIVYFRAGYPISVRSNMLGECLGQILLANRLIDRGVLEESLRRMRSERRQQGQILVEMGALSPHNLQRALVAQMEAKVLDVFAWATGSFRFTETREPHGEPVRLERTPSALILEGIREHYDSERQKAVLEPFTGLFVSPSPDARRRLQEISTNPAERRFAESIDGSRRLEAVLMSAPIPVPEARLLLVAMAEAGMIEPGRAARRPVEAGVRPPPMLGDPPSRPGPGDAAGSPITGESTRGRAVPAEQRSREEMEMIHEGMKAQTFFELLGVAEDASPAVVDQSYEARARDFHPDRFRLRPDEARAAALKIFDLLGEAHTTLREPGRRKRYLAKLEQERADRVLETMNALPPPVAEKVYYTGVEHLRARRYREASDAFRHAIELAPGQASYHGALGWALFRTAPADPGAVSAGLTELRRALEMNGNDPWVRISLGRFYAETGWPDQAIAEFETALRLNPALTEIQDEIHRLRGEA